MIYISAETRSTSKFFIDGVIFALGLYGGGCGSRPVDDVYYAWI